jgi:CRP-like cAMP-binding protein/CheY-like chemotaxis protein
MGRLFQLSTADFSRQPLTLVRFFANNYQGNLLYAGWLSGKPSSHNHFHGFRFCHKNLVCQRSSLLCLAINEDIFQMSGSPLIFVSIARLSNGYVRRVKNIMRPTKKKILVIEDHPEVRENTCEILTLANYDVVEAGNGKVGVEVAERERPDLIICDVMMPELDGFGVLHILNKKPSLSTIPFIFLTAKSEKADFRKGMELGADDYLTKPFDDTELLTAVAKRLEKYAMRSRSYSSTAQGLDSFLADAGQVLRRGLSENKTVKHFKKKSQIYTDGDLPASVFYIKSGNVKAFQSHAEGKQLIVGLYKEGDFFGFESILQNGPYHESATALEDTEVLIIPKDDFLTLLYQQEDVAAAFISMLCKKVVDKEKQLLHLAYNSVRQRTAEALLRILKLKGINELIEISREDLAKVVGTASESVIRILAEFRQEELIETDGARIKVLQPAKLESVVRWTVAR